MKAVGQRDHHCIVLFQQARESQGLCKSFHLGLRPGVACLDLPERVARKVRDSNSFLPAKPVQRREVEFRHHCTASENQKAQGHGL